MKTLANFFFLFCFYLGLYSLMDWAIVKYVNWYIGSNHRRIIRVGGNAK